MSTAARAAHCRERLLDELCVWVVSVYVVWGGFRWVLMYRCGARGQEDRLRKYGEI